ncbi:type IV pilus modification protein PilV [Luteimonas sp. e5]
MTRFGSLSRQQGGFTLLEVMIAVLVLAFGLLGFALVQTMTVRFAQSANHRTQAINLAADMLDQMRSNVPDAAAYTAASFAAGTAATSCGLTTGAVTIANNITRWQCQVRQALGEDANARVTFEDGVATVTVAWNDQRWESDAERRTGAMETGRVTLGGRL